MRVKRQLTWRGKLLTAVLSPVVVLGLLELGLRIGGFRYEPCRAHLEGRSYSELRQIEIYQPDPELLWTLRPSSLLDERELGFPLLKKS